MICARTKRAQRVLKHQNCFKLKFTAFWIKSPIFVQKNRIFPELVGSPCVILNTYLLFQMMIDISLTLDFNGVVKHLDRKLVLSASYKLNSSPVVYKDKAHWGKIYCFGPKVLKTLLSVRILARKLKQFEHSKMQSHFDLSLIKNFCT